jgi:lipoprotein-releasing system permease protein
VRGNFRWIGFIASRYFGRVDKGVPRNKNAGSGSSLSPVFSVLGIATGVLALTVIIAVMNGFQLGFIESILEVSSGHVRIEKVPEEAGETLAPRLREMKGVASVLPFRELNVLLRGKTASPRGALIRGVPGNALSLDKGLAGKLKMEAGVFDLSSPDNIVLGAELARFLAVRVGDKVQLLSISGGGESGVYTVTGTFRCGFYEYDLGWAFVNIDRAEALQSGKTPVLEVQLKDRWEDSAAIEKMSPLVKAAAPDAKIVSWREYNASFFGALRTEKLMMFVLVGLIFIVVGLNIFQSQRRIALEKREEIGLLRALGASELSVRLVFVWDGFLIGLLGAGSGLILGLLIAFHIPEVFGFLEWAVNGVISLLNGAGNFAIFSPQVFYIKQIPSRVIPHEVALIFLFGFLSALAAAWFASGRISKTRPAEVLRYE